MTRSRHSVLFCEEEKAPARQTTEAAAAAFNYICHCSAAYTYTESREYKRAVCAAERWIYVFSFLLFLLLLLSLPLAFYLNFTFASMMMMLVLLLLLLMCRRRRCLCFLFLVVHWRLFVVSALSSLHCSHSLTQTDPGVYHILHPALLHQHQQQQHHHHLIPLCLCVWNCAQLQSTSEWQFVCAFCILRIISRRRCRCRSHY